jgi:hypothetical protein
MINLNQSIHVSYDISFERLNLSFLNDSFIIESMTFDKVFR